MSDKSYVTMAQKMCPICGEVEDTGEILMDMRIRDRFEPHTLTGYGLCKAHQKLWEDGYVALVGVNNKGTWNDGHTLKMEQADRSGEVMHIKQDVLQGITGQVFDTPMAFVEQEVIDAIRKDYEAQHGAVPEVEVK